MMTMRATLSLACLLGALNGVSFGQQTPMKMTALNAPAQAQPTGMNPQVWKLYERLEAQDARIQDLESRLLRNEQKVQALPVVSQPSSGDMKSMQNDIKSLKKLEAARAAAVVDTHDEKWVHKWGGRIMGDTVLFADQDPGVGGQDYFEFRRLRFFASGTGYGVYDYKLQVDFEPENTITHDAGSTQFGGGVAVEDAYVGIHELPWLGYARFGNFKVPFSLEELTSSKFITFMERSVPNVFAPGREVGAAFFNHSESECWTWAAGAFYDSIDDVGKQRVDNNQGVRAAARVTWTPYYDEASDGRYLLHLGVAFHFTDDQDNIVRFASSPEVHEGPTIVDTGALAADHFTVLGTEAAWIHGPLSLQGEFMWTNVDMNAGSNVDLFGAYGEISYFLTGEHRTYERTYGEFTRVVPLENFWVIKTCEGRCAGWGAWELAARWSFLDFNETAASEQLHEITAGINWYWNPYTRLMLNWIHPFAQKASGSPEANIIGMRLQVDW